MASDAPAGVAHLVGIGGIGMSGLARLLVARGYRVSGSDLQLNELTEALVPLGVRVVQGHDAANLPEGCTVVVRSAAVPESNPELGQARERRIDILRYSQMLGRLMGEKAGIAVAGCHGKTTTTAMISYVLSRAGFDPSFICGGVIPQLKANAAPGSGKHFVAEACEFNRSFHDLSPQCAVITNIEEDHLDYYKDIDDIVGAFREFAIRVGDKGVVIGGVDNPHVANLVAHLKVRGEGYSVQKETDWTASKIAVEDGIWRFEVLKYGRPFGSFTLAVPGVHNVSNALAAIAAVTWAGVGRELIQLALSEFAGAERRFQVLGERKGALVVDDYGHHPTEVQATLRAAKERFPDKKIWCVFQPHQYSRTRFFLKEFARSFGDAHLVLLPEIYAARDEDVEKRKVSSADLAKLLDENGKAALFLPTFDEVVAFLEEKVDASCVVITMGAGRVGDVARRFLLGPS
ncbi:MAG: UDP-N-acetylmuramate--L-alanine ligase [Planctomycetes bacterium]|nr:UDP-N-acetylmuramate--L-alanine ligase [Planctomycetota bacterium]